MDTQTSEIAPTNELHEFHKLRNFYKFYEFGPVKHGSKAAMWVASCVAWFGVILTNVCNVLDVYKRESGAWPGLYGKSAHGWPGAWTRFIEGISYFTMISNILVAVMFMLVALQPFKRTKWRVAMMATTMMMITVTSIVFLTVILPYLNLSGMAVLTSPWQHVVTPLTAWIVWAFWGPRGYFGSVDEGAQDTLKRSWRAILPAMVRTLVIPVAWSAWMLIYGAFTHLYPYGFVNVNQIGYAGVAVSLVVVMIFGLLLELVFWKIDKALTKKSS